MSEKRVFLQDIAETIGPELGAPLGLGLGIHEVAQGNYLPGGVMMILGLSGLIKSLHDVDGAFFADSSNGLREWMTAAMAPAALTGFMSTLGDTRTVAAGVLLTAYMTACSASMVISRKGNR